MSTSEVKRFVDDLSANKKLLDEAQGKSTGIESLVSLAKERGYDFTVDEVKEYIRAESQHELSDEDLDAIAGGAGQGSSAKTAVMTTSVSATTVSGGPVVVSSGPVNPIQVIVSVTTMT
ncbi:MAG: Nif11-like leader peptide family RiPP precursor [Devosia sp.]